MKYLFIVAISLTPIIGFTQFPTGVKNFKEGNFEQAIKDFTAAIEQDKQNWDAWYNRALCKENIGEHESALSDLRTVLNVKPDDKEAILHVGINEMMLGQVEQSIVTLTRCLELIPKSDENYQVIPLASKAYYNRALAHEKIGNTEAAIKDLRRSVETDPPALPALFKLANIKYAAEDYKSAISNWDMYITYQPYSAEAYNNRAMCQSALGNKKLAISDFSKALFVDSTNTEIYFNRGFQRYKLGEIEEAKKDFSKAIALDEKNDKALYYRAKIYARQKNYSGQIDDLKKILTLKPEDEEAKAMLSDARINWLLNQTWIFIGIIVILVGIAAYFLRRILKN